jgi:hypothetical protein
VHSSYWISHLTTERPSYLGNTSTCTGFATESEIIYFGEPVRPAFGKFFDTRAWFVGVFLCRWVRLLRGRHLSCSIRASTKPLTRLDEKAKSV